MAKIKDIYFEDRPREIAKKNGIEKLSVSNLLALIIGSGVKGNSCIDIANELLSKCSDLENLLRLDYKSLEKIKGLKESKIFLLLATFELFKRIFESISKKDDISSYNPYDVVKQFAFELKKDEEIIILGYKNYKFINKYQYTSYSSDFLKFSFNDFKSKVDSSKINQIIVIHNHKGNESSPSNDDIFTTFMIQEELNKMKISLIDHIIISEKNFFSFKKSNML